MVLLVITQSLRAVKLNVASAVAGPFQKCSWSNSQKQQEAHPDLNTAIQLKVTFERGALF